MTRAHFSTMVEPKLREQLKIEAVLKHQTITETLEQILQAHFENPKN